MIYLTTGGNGAGKTLFTLYDVRAAQLKENRPVYYHGFEPLQPIIDFGWLPFEPEKWQDLPDGSICIFDECQNEFPAKLPGAVPDFINAIAQFRRKRGFDFYLITPHPSLIHVNVRRLIETPSWHRHMKRPAAGDMCSELRWSTANLNCEKPNASATGQVSMRAYPKEVYKWYKSATLHTVKRQIPKQLYVLGACLIGLPVLGWYALQSIGDITKKASIAPAASSQAQGSNGSVVGGTGSVPDGPQSAADYIAGYTPRLEGLPHTAARYDEVTKPTTAPYPAACVQMAKRCECFTQQGTKLPTPGELCKQIVANGYFMDWSPNHQGSTAVRGEDPRTSAPLSGSPGQAEALRLSEPRLAATAEEAMKAKAATADGSNLSLMRPGSRPVSSN